MNHALKAKEFVANDERMHWHDKALWFVREKRDLASKGIPEWEQLRDYASIIKSHTMSRLDYYLEEFEKNANEKGMLAAIEAGVDEVAVFAAASESFSQRNINCSIEQSLERFEPVFRLARQHNLRVRGYVSCVMGCPYEGAIRPDAVLAVSQTLLEKGCY